MYRACKYIKCEAEIVIWNSHLSTFPFLFCEEFHYCHAFALHSPLYVSFLCASHLFEECLGSKGPKGSPVFSADTSRMSHNPVLGGMKDKFFIWDCGCCFPFLFPLFWAMFRQNKFTESVNSLYTNPKPCAQKQDLDLNETIINHCESLKLPCNVFGRGAAMKVIQHPQDLPPANHVAFSGTDSV